MQVRGGLYSFLGCEGCGDLANSAAFVEGACREVFGANGSEAACEAAGAGAPTVDAREVINATVINIRGQPPSEFSGVSVPLFGGAPMVRDATARGPQATAPPAPAPSPEGMDADSSATPEGEMPGVLPRIRLVAQERTGSCRPVSQLDCTRGCNCGWCMVCLLPLGLAAGGQSSDTGNEPCRRGACVCVSVCEHSALTSCRAHTMQCTRRQHLER